MRNRLIALMAAGALVASGPAIAQSRAADPAPVRSGAEMQDSNEMRGGYIIPAIAVVGVILLILALTDTWPFDDEDSVSP